MRDRSDGTSRFERLRQIPPEVGRFVALLAAGSPDGMMVEIGTSAGYSTMWLSLACEMLGRTLHTYELLPAKTALARETFRQAGIEPWVELTEGDVRDYLGQMENVAFCFLDTEKELYAECYEAIVPKLASGGLLVADNAINFEYLLRPMLDRALADERVDAMVVPIGNGELVCRKL